jgi:transposase
MLPVPEQTARVAKAAFPKGNVYMTMRDQLGTWYQDSDFVSLFKSHQGRPAESPGRLALVTVMQFAEGLTDRQAAESVRGRIDWKYALALEVDDPGFDFSVLSEFRDRLIADEAEHQLLNDMLKRFKCLGLLKARGRQRTDSTHVLAAVRKLNRLECVGETLRAALNALAVATPDWLLEQVTPDWFDRYGPRFEQYRLPKAKTERERLAETIGADGHQLLLAIHAESAPTWLQKIPAVKILDVVWSQQYYVGDDGQVKWRAAQDLPRNKSLIQSPYDPEARNRTKRSLNWTGYAAHLTETCDEDTPNLITDVQTTPSTTGDIEMTNTIHKSLAEKDLLPSEHIVDTGYVAAEPLVSSRTNYSIDLLGPAPPDSNWQARTGQGFDISCFAVDWDAQTVTCPQGQVNRSWRVRQDHRSKDTIEVRFDRDVCRSCVTRGQCTRAKDNPRTLKLKSQAQHVALQNARQRQDTASFKEQYKARAGVEGTISQGTRCFDLRRSRYIGLAKTHLQHIITAAAMNLTRSVAWLEGIPKAQTRQSRFAALAPST